ncbi:MAG: four helix bundle protein [Gemmatimonadales bacterium]
MYRVTQSFPRAEVYGLVSQMRRSACSIPANLAEGTGRKGDRELRRYIRLCLGSATELEYHLLLARDLGLLEPSSFHGLDDQVHRVQAMLFTLMRSLRGQCHSHP